MPTLDSSDWLALLCGSAAPEAFTARKITALTINPGCRRRAVLDAAGVNKTRLLVRLGYPVRDGRSPFAIVRGRAFEEQVKRDGYAALITLLRAALAVPIAEAAVADLNGAGETADLPSRATRTRHLLRRLVAGKDERLILDRPVLPFTVAGRTVHLEPDALTHRINGRFYLIEIKSFSAIDGRADAEKVAEVTKQAATYVLALRALVRALGGDPADIADEYLLVCPKDFSNLPFCSLVDLRQQLEHVAFQLARLEGADRLAAALFDALGPAATLDLSTDALGKPFRADHELRATLDVLAPLFGPDCLAHCELAPHCRAEATVAGEPARFGSTVRDAVPGIASTGAALRLISGAEEPDETQRDVVEMLRRAEQLREQALGRARSAEGGAA
ncbi:hypothetical protein [Kitasatospora sp. NBC_01266]|uniref:hypothetical protein n=1 Tax=Kitasatospora sp. NBC_01266 TaxID=2903572 RepID=UPI002E36ADCA|nr:hypothetical protein [Kitasatospora sp. NBC_01266]